MEQKRLILATTLSVLMFLVWYLVVIPRVMPPKPKVPRNAQAAGADRKEADPVEKDEAEEEEAPNDAAVAGISSDNNAPPAENDENDAPQKAELPRHPARDVVLGSLDPQTGFRQLVTLKSQGAAVGSIVLGDHRYVDLRPPHDPLVVLGVDDIRPRTLELDVPQIRGNLRKLNWEVTDLQPANAPHTQATFQLEIGGIQIRKKYTLHPVDPNATRHPEAPAYSLDLEIGFRNTTDKEQVLNYLLQGPTGLVLENIENTSKYRDVVAGFLTAPNTVNHQQMAVTSIADGKTEEWKSPIQYIGVDSQYFAALISPQGDPFEKPYLASTRQMLIGQKNASRPAASEVSVELRSKELTLAPAGDDEGADSVTHAYALFAGPKRDEVLPPLADQVIDFGTFLGIGRGMISTVARWLMKLLVFFHSLIGNWGIAIICLTVCVRAVMVPISIKQARNAARMQELAPKMAAIKEKYKEDPTKQTQAIFELYRQHNVKPFQMGCLPALLQMPIFIGLYQALNHAVDLRMAPFLYFDNLAAPDALFQLPFAVPFVGWKEFNLLPIIVFGLFMLQQKLFSPPPANEEQEMQMKVMNIMMIMMLFTFYKVPAGLCLYFIVSSLWGITEKLLLPKPKPKEGAAAAAGASPAPASPPPASPPARRNPAAAPEPEAGNESLRGLWGSLLKAAEKPDPAARGPRPRKRR